MRFGLNDDLRAFDGDTLRRAQNIGCDTIRIPLGWNVSPAAMAASIQVIREHDLRPLICVWLSTSEVPTAEQFAGGCAGFAAEFPTVMLQLGNEFNHPDFGHLSAPTAREYIARAAKQVREVNPDQKIIASAVSPLGVGWRYYLHEMTLGLVTLDVDPALHFYPRGPNPIRQLAEDIGLASTYGTGKVHITEAGIMRSEYGSDQAALSALAYDRALTLNVRTMIFHRAVPDPNPSEWERKAKLAVLTNDKLRRALKEARDA